MFGLSRSSRAPWDGLEGLHDVSADQVLRYLDSEAAKLYPEGFELPFPDPLSEEAISRRPTAASQSAADPSDATQNLLNLSDEASVLRTDAGEVFTRHFAELAKRQAEVSVLGIALRKTIRNNNYTASEIAALNTRIDDLTGEYERRTGLLRAEHERLNATIDEHFERLVDGLMATES